MAEKNEITPEILEQASKVAKPLLHALEEAAGRPPKSSKKSGDKGHGHD